MKKKRKADGHRLLRVAAYCRVSTAHDEQGGSLAQQEAYFRQRIACEPDWVNAGIFTEKVSGLRICERPEFISMLKKCRKQEIDLIITKSISRFGRNTLDVLGALKELRVLGVDVFFEKEGLRLCDGRIQFMLTAFCAFAQAESENMSGNIKWGIRKGFQDGTSGYAEFVCFGYKRGAGGKLVIDEPEGAIVRRIFELRVSGSSLGAISDWLYEQGIPSPRGGKRWSRETISKLLRNEKYVGDVLLQKTFVKDVLSGKQLKNEGELNRYLIREHHPAIVSREVFELVGKAK